MDPYLEHPMLWEGFHTRLIVEIANQLQPMLDPRYIASVEERVFLESGRTRVPDVRVELAASSKKRSTRKGNAVALVEPRSPGVSVVQIEADSVRQRRIEILDRQNRMRLVTAIEVVSPSNKQAGEGRKSYQRKQAEFLARDCHLVEVDLIRNGRHVLAIPETAARRDDPDFEYLACVSRLPDRTRFELYRMHLRDRPAPISIPLAAPDDDVLFDLKIALDEVWQQGRYYWKVKYDDPCVPRLSRDDQDWATGCWKTWRAANSHLFIDSD